MKNVKEREFAIFLQQWNSKYESSISKVEIFDSKVAGKLTLEQKEYFARVFYHIRGRFHDFLWFVGSRVATEEMKKVILGNIEEEFGSTLSHEQLYFRFAHFFGVDVTREIVEESYYLPFARRFNQRHLEWLVDHDSDSCFSAFAAYERLDNIDYAVLDSMAEAMGIPRAEKMFFEVHRGVQHFEMAGEELQSIWDRAPEKVKEAFEFIGDHQIAMWHELSENVVEYRANEKARLHLEVTSLSSSGRKSSRGVK